jgi:hypothetical protein
MTPRSGLWRVGAALFVIINVAGAGYAIAMGEPMHAFTHAVLMTLGLGAYITWRAVQPRRKYSTPNLSNDQIDYLQQSVDALALEVERIGEAQRFRDKQRLERSDNPPPRKEQ